MRIKQVAAAIHWVLTFLCYVTGGLQRTILLSACIETKTSMRICVDVSTCRIGGYISVNGTISDNPPLSHLRPRTSRRALIWLLLEGVSELVRRPRAKGQHQHQSPSLKGRSVPRNNIFKQQLAMLCFTGHSMTRAQCFRLGPTFRSMPATEQRAVRMLPAPSRQRMHLCRSSQSLLPSWSLMSCLYHRLKFMS